MKRHLTAIALGVVVAVGGIWWLNDGVGAWNPEQKEIVVRRVSNGYIVQWRMTNNPYPIRESIAANSEDAGAQVKAYLDMVVLGRGRTR